MDTETHKTYSELALDHAEHPRHNEPLKDYNGHARLTGPCGDTMEFWILVKEEKIQDIGFTSDGCGSSHACGSMTSELAMNKQLMEAGALEQQDVLNALGDFPEASEHCALLAVNTLHAACNDYVGVRNLRRIQHKIVILSGKGGVGKSTVAVNCAVSLMQAGKRVGLLDVDIHGPSVPAMLGLENVPVEQGLTGILPVDWKGLKVMSIGFLLRHPDDAIIWRGPRKTAVIKQFLREVEWGDLDYLIIDALREREMKFSPYASRGGTIDGAVVVTTPQKISAIDARKSVTFCRELKIPVLGVLENMNGFVCPHCGTITEILPTGAGKLISQEMNVPYLGSIPMDLRMARAADDGKAFMETNPGDPITVTINNVFNHLLEEDK